MDSVLSVLPWQGRSLPYIYCLRNPETAAGGEVYALALSLAKHGTFANPFYRTGITGASAHMTPLWPLTMALLMSTLGADFILHCSFWRWLRPG